MIHGIQFRENWILVTHQTTEMEQPLSHIIRSENQIHNSKTSNLSIWRLGGVNVLCKVSQGTRAPSARPRNSNTTEHSLTGTRNRRDRWSWFYFTLDFASSEIDAVLFFLFVFQVLIPFLEDFSSYEIITLSLFILRTAGLFGICLEDWNSDEG